MRMKAENTKYRGNSGSSFILYPSSLCSSAFTLVELLVVIGIIVILIAILLPAVGKVRTSARTAETTALIKDLSASIEAYNNDFHAYPGPFSNFQICNSISAGASAGVIDASNTKGYANASSTSISFSTTPAVPPGFDTTNAPNFGSLTMGENLVLGLMGGLLVDSSNNLVYNPSQVGNGPNTLLVGGINKHSNAYVTDQKHLSWSTNASGNKTGHFVDELSAAGASDTVIPEFVDTYPDALPLLYLRAKKGVSTSPPYDEKNNTIVTYDPSESGAAPFRVGEYDLHQIIGYTGAKIGTGRKPGTYAGWTGTPTHGLSATTTDKVDVLSTLKSPGVGSVKYYYPFNAYAYFRNAALSSPIDWSVDATGTAQANADYTNPSGTARNDVPFQKDTFIIISAGPDRIFGTSDDITNFGPVGH